MVNMLSRERKPTTEDLQGRPRDGHGPDGHVNSQATQAALQFEGIPRRHDKDALPDPDDAGTLEEHVEKLSAVVRGDYDPAPRRDFVERFVRPGGLAHAVAPQVASAVLELAKIGTAVSV